MLYFPLGQSDKCTFNAIISLLQRFRTQSENTTIASVGEAQHSFFKQQNYILIKIIS